MPTDLTNFIASALSELPKFGWIEIAQVRSEIGILTYQSANRIMIIKIQDASFWGSEIEMIASPVTKKD